MTSPLRILFMGTPEFALPAFQALKNDPEGRFDICLVLSKPDAPAGRGFLSTASAISQAAVAADVELMQPLALRGLEYQLLLQRIEELQIDIAVVTAYGMILTEELIDAPRRGTVNIHASLLPRWRGAAPIERAILAGDIETGVSLQQVRRQLDSGPVYASAATPIGLKSYTELLVELGELGAALLADNLWQIATGALPAVAQNTAFVTYADKLTRGELALDPAISALANARMVQAANRHNPAKATLAGRRVSVLEAHVAESPAPEMPASEACVPEARATNASTGSMMTTAKKDSLLLKTIDGWLEVTSLVPDGKRQMAASDFMRGLKTKNRLEDLVWEKAV